MNSLLSQETINGVNVLLYCTAGIGITFTVVCGWICPYMARRYNTSFLLDKEILLINQVNNPPNVGSPIKPLNFETTNKEYLYTVVINSILDEVDELPITYNSKRSYKGKNNKFSSTPRRYKHNLNKLNNNSKFNDWEGVYIQ